MRILIAVLLLAPLAHGSVSIVPAGFAIEVAFAGDTVCRNSMDGGDSAAYQAVLTILSGDPVTRGNVISVFLQNGVVTLSGKVPTEKIKQRAEKLTHRVKGVCAVKNQITVQKR